MNDALKHLRDRKKYFEEQIDSYHNYVEAAMATMQRGKGYGLFPSTYTMSINATTGRIDLLFLSPNNFSIFATCRNLAKLHSSALSSIVPRRYTRKASCCRSTRSLLGSLTRLTSSFHQTRRESSQWRCTTIPLALRIASHLRTFEWRIFSKANLRIRHLSHYSMAWPWSTSSYSCIRSIKSMSMHMTLRTVH